jgi:hypothetical protein
VHVLIQGIVICRRGGGGGGGGGAGSAGSGAWSAGMWCGGRAGHGQQACGVAPCGVRTGGRDWLQAAASGVPHNLRCCSACRCSAVPAHAARSAQLAASHEQGPAHTPQPPSCAPPPPARPVGQTLTAVDVVGHLVVVAPHQGAAANQVVAGAQQAIDLGVGAHGAVVAAVLHRQPDPGAAQACTTTQPAARRRSVSTAGLVAAAACGALGTRPAQGPAAGECWGLRHAAAGGRPRGNMAAHPAGLPSECWGRPRTARRRPRRSPG